MKGQSRHRESETWSFQEVEKIFAGSLYTQKNSDLTSVKTTLGRRQGIKASDLPVQFSFLRKQPSGQTHFPSVEQTLGSVQLIFSVHSFMATAIPKNSP